MVLVSSFTLWHSLSPPPQQASRGNLSQPLVTRSIIPSYHSLSDILSGTCVGVQLSKNSTHSPYVIPRAMVPTSSWTMTLSTIEKKYSTNTMLSLPVYPIFVLLIPYELSPMIYMYVHLEEHSPRADTASNIQQKWSINPGPSTQHLISSYSWTTKQGAM